MMNLSVVLIVRLRVGARIALLRKMMVTAKYFFVLFVLEEKVSYCSVKK